MRKISLFAYIFVCLISLLGIRNPIKAQPCKVVVGYYPNWQWYDRNQLVDPFSIDFASYTIINYAFFKPESNGSITSTDPWADENLLLGEINWSTTPPSYYPNTSIIERAHNAGVKVLVSIGGWTMSEHFPGIASNSGKRALFASECNRLISTYGFDGIDIDWEYPGYVPNGGTPADKSNYTLLMQQIRDSIDALGQINGKTYLLTSCFGASPSNAANIEWSAILPIVDMINLMTYDYFGPWDCVANHNAPLYAPAIGDPTFNLHATFSLLKNQYLVPPSKINLGVAFYGRSQTYATGLYGATSCNPDLLTFAADLGSPLYYNILNNMSLFNYYWDSTAMVPYLYGHSLSTAAQTFVSFDDPASIALKAKYAVDHHAGGVIIWEITGDYIETYDGSGIISGTPLLDTLNHVLCNSPSISIQDIEKQAFDAMLYPNPAKDLVYLTVQTDHNSETEFRLLTTYGKVLKIQQITTGPGTHTTRIDLSDLSAGCYIVTISNQKRIISKKLTIKG
jgi:chitinase